jgi:hypothetical protein
MWLGKTGVRVESPHAGLLCGSGRFEAERAVMPDQTLLTMEDDCSSGPSAGNSCSRDVSMMDVDRFETCPSSGGSFERTPKRLCLWKPLDSLTEDLLAKILSELDTKDRLRARFVCTPWSLLIKTTGWGRINLRFVPDPPRDGLRDEGNLYRRAEVRARWLVQQNLGQVLVGLHEAKGLIRHFCLASSLTSGFIVHGLSWDRKHTFRTEDEINTSLCVDMCVVWRDR